MEIRKDFESVATYLHRLAGIGSEFSRLSNDAWAHLKNREDFDKIYSLPESKILPLDNLYAKGRDCAIFMSSRLRAFNDVGQFPSLTSYLDSFDNTWAYEHEFLQDFIKNIKIIVESLDRAPWAVREMIAVFDDQLRLLAAVRETIFLLKQTHLYKIEKGEIPVEKESSINIHQGSGKININSTDNSTNITIESSPIFAMITEAVTNSSIGTNEKEKLLNCIEAMKKTKGKPTFVDSYKDFIQNAANHMSVVSPFIPALTSLIS